MGRKSKLIGGQGGEGDAQDEWEDDACGEEATSTAGTDGFGGGCDGTFLPSTAPALSSWEPSGDAIQSTAMVGGCGFCGGGGSGMSSMSGCVPPGAAAVAGQMLRPRPTIVTPPMCGSPLGGGMRPGLLQTSMMQGASQGILHGGLGQGIRSGMRPGLQPGLQLGMQPGMLSNIQPNMTQGMVQGMMGGLSGLQLQPFEHLNQNSTGIDPDVQELCDRYGIEDRLAIRLTHLLYKRPDTIEGDLQRLWEVLETARSPAGLLCVKMKEMEDGTFVGKRTPAADIIALGKKFKLDDQAQSKLEEVLAQRSDSRVEDIKIVEKHLEVSNRPSALVMMLLSRLRKGEKLSNPTWEPAPGSYRDRLEQKGELKNRDRRRSRSRGDRDRGRGRDGDRDRDRDRRDDRDKDRERDRRDDRDRDRGGDRRDRGRRTSRSRSRSRRRR